MHFFFFVSVLSADAAASAEELHQAFGAVQFAVFEHPEAEKDISQLWDDFKPRFEREIWGMGLSLWGMLK